MLGCFSLSLKNPGNFLEVGRILRKKPGPDEVLIMIYFVGLGRYDIHKMNNDWDDTNFPLTPGIELVGLVDEVGSNVFNLSKLDYVLVGNFIDSIDIDGKLELLGISDCINTKTDDNNFKITKGALSQVISVNKKFVIKLPNTNGLPLTRVVPLASTGLASFSPLKKYMKKNSKVIIMGLGGIGHIAVKLVIEMGGIVDVISSTEEKRFMALYDLLVNSFFNSNDMENNNLEENSYDLIIDTLPVDHNLDNYLKLLKDDGKYILLGTPKYKSMIDNSIEKNNRVEIIKSFSGTINELWELIKFCGDKGILADVKTIEYSEVNEAISKILNKEAYFKYVVDTTSFQKINHN